jgi:hypothetical protein
MSYKESSMGMFGSSTNSRESEVKAGNPEEMTSALFKDIIDHAECLRSTDPEKIAETLTRFHQMDTVETRSAEQPPNQFTNLSRQELEELADKSRVIIEGYTPASHIARNDAKATLRKIEAELRARNDGPQPAAGYKHF